MQNTEHNCSAINEKAELLLETSRTMSDISNILDSLFFTYQELSLIKSRLEKTIDNESKSI